MGSRYLCVHQPCLWSQCPMVSFLCFLLMPCQGSGGLFLLCRPLSITDVLDAISVVREQGGTVSASL